MKKLKKVFSIVFIISLLIFSNGCGLLRNISKTKDKTRTVTEIFIDTNIVLIFDTVPVYNTVLISDTAFIENKTAIAKSYFNPGLNKIVLELKGKQFTVPVKFHKKETKTETIKQTESKPKSLLIIAIFVISLLFLILIFKK